MFNHSDPYSFVMNGNNDLIGDALVYKFFNELFLGTKINKYTFYCLDFSIKDGYLILSALCLSAKDTEFTVSPFVVNNEIISIRIKHLQSKQSITIYSC